MKQKNAVVATKTIEALREYDLREFFTKSGSFVANASLTPVVSPQGERVTGRGDRVDMSIDLKQVAGIKCASCDSILVANKQVAHNHDVTNCIVCGAALEYPDDDEEEDLGGELTGDEDDLDDLDDLDSFDEEPVLDDDEDDEDDAEDEEPTIAAWAGDPEILEDLGVSARVLRKITEDSGDDPGRVLAELGETVGFAELLEALR